jgi:hypothetical protein
MKLLLVSRVSIYLDDTATDWMINESSSQQQRTLKYKVPYESTFIGKGTILTREKQVRKVQLTISSQ